MVGNTKKSQGMPLNVVIIAVLALIVLVVITAVFTGRVKIFSETLQSCAAKQGACESGFTCSKNKAAVPSTNCPETEEDKRQGNNLCCVQVFN